MKRIKFLVEEDKDVINEFLKELDLKEVEKIKRNINLLNDLGFEKLINTEMVGGVKGYDNLWYFRAKYRKNIFRIFFFRHRLKSIEVYILLHGFRKKTDELPESEIKTAVKRKKSLLEDLED
ncbi:type II toxin-antitoxin system RelE/ParE family toxin [Halarsenatibacter silvermanii]|uniref:Phage-related protein n=1 Tax=Halarsenatibacter silvermanii TaxID=321763 RepID=A0A1G9TN67_9FIRM|nr:type II toxin-antitoxin system RelE/ParE family toxin [Halarsenatibacter silvermanii]SDM48864.1 Phage-related protein [Halarsenatibacter silvermanii]